MVVNVGVSRTERGWIFKGTKNELQGLKSIVLVLGVFYISLVIAFFNGIVLVQKIHQIWLGTPFTRKPMRLQTENQFIESD